MVLTLKSWLTKMHILEFNLADDNFDGNLLWCQDWCPFPKDVVYEENGGNLVIPLTYYFAEPELFEELDVDHPVINPMNGKPFWDL